MIEIGLIVWGTIYLLWVISSIAMGDFKESVVNLTLAFLSFPLVLVVCVIVSLVLLVSAPIGVVFSKSVREEVLRQRKEKALARAVNKE